MHVHGGGWQGVTKIDDEPGLRQTYETSDKWLMHLQQAVAEADAVTCGATVGTAVTTGASVTRPAGTAMFDVPAAVPKARSPATSITAWAVRAETADKYHLRTLSDLKPVAPQLVIGGPGEAVDVITFFDAGRQAHARAALERIRGHEGLSRDVLEVVTRALGSA